MSRILFICRKGELYSVQYTYGISGLFNSATFAADALSDRYDTSVVKVDDENCIDREVYNFRPDVVILEAIWVSPNKLRELTTLQRYAGIKWVVRVHSKPPFLANEGLAISRLTEYSTIPNVIISGNNHEFNIMMSSLNISSTYLPNMYTIPFTNNQSNYNNDYVNIGCFGAIRPMKNHIQQAIAAIIFGNKINKTVLFHVNATRSEQGGDNVLKNLRAIFNYTHHQLIEHPWLEHKDFCQLVGTMDIGLQVSLSESFNIVSADFVSQNVPIVTSKEVEFICSIYHAEPGSIKSIADVLDFAYKSRGFGVHRINKWLLDYQNTKAIKAWTTFIGN